MIPAIVVAHAGWAPGRAEGLQRICDALPIERIFKSKRREHASVWAIRIWEWVAEHSRPVIVLNDDVLPHPKLAEIVGAMNEANGDRALSLHPNNPAALQLYRDGHKMFRCYVLTGPAYQLTPEAARGLLAWYDLAPVNFRTRINEDNYGIHWSWDRQDPIWQSTISLVEHDVTIPSTLGYDTHPNRKAYVHASDVKDDMLSPDFWRAKDPPWAPNTWAPPAYCAQVRRMIRANVKICDWCLGEPAAVASDNGQLGVNCLRNIMQSTRGRM